MSTVDKALETQIKNIEAKTGKSLDELTKHIIESPLTKHGELRNMVKEEFGLGYGMQTPLFIWRNELQLGMKKKNQ